MDDPGLGEWVRYNHRRWKKNLPGADAMTDDDVQARLLKEIHLRGYDDHYIDRNEEREILQIALQLGVGYEVARADMTAVCEQSGYVLESAVVRVMGERLTELVNDAGAVDREAFERIVAEGVQLVRGKKGDRDVRAMLVTLMEDTGHNRVKRGWFSNWYRVMKKELGVG
jgi:hypothetical protein